MTSAVQIVGISDLIDYLMTVRFHPKPIKLFSICKHLLWPILLAYY